MGDVQRLPNGNTIVGFSTKGVAPRGRRQRHRPAGAGRPRTTSATSRSAPTLTARRPNRCRASRHLLLSARPPDDDTKSQILWLAAAVRSLTLALRLQQQRPTTGSVTCTDGNVVANEANDYAFSSTLTLRPVKVKSMCEPDLRLGRRHDGLPGHPLNADHGPEHDPVMLWKLPLAELQTKLNADTLIAVATWSVVAAASASPDGATTSAKLYDFTVNGTVDHAGRCINPYFDADDYPPMNSYIAGRGAPGRRWGRGSGCCSPSSWIPRRRTPTVTLTNRLDAPQLLRQPAQP